MGGDARQRWVAGLPGLIESTLQRWHLTPDGEPRTGTLTAVVPVRDADGVRQACKFSFVEDDNAGEIPTLRLWAGRGAATLLRADPPAGVLLLEWLGEPLQDWWDAEEATQVAAGLYRDLHRPAVPQLPDGHALVRGWLAELASLGRRAPAPPRLVVWALRARWSWRRRPGRMSSTATCTISTCCAAAAAGRDRPQGLQRRRTWSPSP